MKKKLLKLVLPMVLLNMVAHGQMLNYQWVKSIGSAASDRAVHIQADGSGNTYVIGNYNGLIDLDPSGNTYSVANAGNSDIFVAKYDNTGSFVWGFGIGSPGNESGYCIRLVNNNFYITGQFQGTIDVDPGMAVSNLTTVSSSAECFFAKYDLNGNFVLARNFVSGGTNAFSRGTGITADASGNMYITGTYSGTVDFDASGATFNMVTGVANAMFVSKYNASGNFVFANSTQNGDVAQPWAITLDNSGNIIVTGSFANAVGQNVDFDPGAPVVNLTSTGTSDMFCAKYTNAGAYTWAFKVGTSVGTSITEGLSVKADALDNVILTGHYTNLSDFDPGPSTATLTVPSPSNSNVFVAKYSSAGTYSWAVGFGGTGPDVGNNIAVESSGNIFATGTFSGTVDFDPGAGAYSLTSAGSTDIFVTRFSPTGTFSTAVAIGGNAADGVGALAINPSANELFLAGFYTGVADFDPSLSTATLSALGATDAFIEKFQFCVSAPSQPGSISGSTAMCAGSGAANYSVAVVAGAGSYSWSLPAGWSGSSSGNTISATPGASGIFSLSASNACGTSALQTLSVTVNPSPTITAATNVSVVCSNFNQSATLTASGGNSYTWNPGGTGGTIVITPSATANYTLTGTDGNGCTNSSVFTQSTTVCGGLPAEALSIQEMLVYPNPTNGEFNIQTSGTSQIEIYNGTGQKVKSFSSVPGQTYSIGGLEPGIYFVKNRVGVWKLVRE